MQTFLFDIFPIIIFFIAYKIWGIYVATSVAISVALIETAYNWFRYRKIDKMQITTLGLIVFFGGATLIFHNPMFIKWKVSVLYWLFALVIFFSQFFGKKPMAQRLLGEQIELPEKIWRRLTWAWTLFFGALGFLNLYVMFRYPTNVWVNFKLFGIFGLTLVFFIIQGFYLMRHIKHDTHSKN